MERSFELRFLDMEIAFQTQLDAARIQAAAEFAEGQYQDLKKYEGANGRDELLALLVLGVADQFLQAQHRLDALNTDLFNMTERIRNLLHCIEERVPISLGRS